MLGIPKQEIIAGIHSDNSLSFHPSDHFFLLIPGDNFSFEIGVGMFEIGDGMFEIGDV